MEGASVFSKDCRVAPKRVASVARRFRFNVFLDLENLAASISSSVSGSSPEDCPLPEATLAESSASLGIEPEFSSGSDAEALESSAGESFLSFCWRHFYCKLEIAVVVDWKWSR